MSEIFNSFKTIKQVLEKNSKNITKKNTALKMLYDGFVEHFLAYIDAYQILFENNNFYVCKNIDRGLLDLYIKARSLLIADNPENLAKDIIDEKKIKRSYFSDIYENNKGYITDTELCVIFDRIDNNYAVNQCADVAKNRKIGLWEKRYIEDSRYVHPRLPCIWSYTRDKENDWRVLIEEDANSFVRLASSVLYVITEILILVNKQ